MNMTQSAGEVQGWTAEDMELLPFDPVDYWEDEEAVTAYLDAAIQRDDVEVFLDALGDVARAYGMGKIANEVDVNRVSLYRSLSKQGNPSFATVKKVLSVLGYEVRVVKSEDAESVE